jgi:thiol:disulfide interchange protein
MSYKENRDLKIESIGHALWRSLQGSLVIFLIAALLTALICWLGGWRSLSDFGNGLIYAGVVLVFVGWSIFRGNQALVGSQLDPYNPMNTATPSGQSARTRQFWQDYMGGMNTTAVIGFSVALCIGLGWLIVELVN